MGSVGAGENVNGDSLGRKNKYRRMDSEATDDDFDDALNDHPGFDRARNTRKYVFFCAVFASLNNVLLGYGNHTLPSVDFLSKWKY